MKHLIPCNLLELYIKDGRECNSQTSFFLFQNWQEDAVNRLPKKFSFCISILISSQALSKTYRSTVILEIFKLNFFIYGPYLLKTERDYHYFCRFELENIKYIWYLICTWSWSDTIRPWQNMHPNALGSNFKFPENLW